jgi:hypothetical protein
MTIKLELNWRAIVAAILLDCGGMLARRIVMAACG